MTRKWAIAVFALVAVTLSVIGYSQHNLMTRNERRGLLYDESFGVNPVNDEDTYTRGDRQLAYEQLRVQRQILAAIKSCR